MAENLAALAIAIAVVLTVSTAVFASTSNTIAGITCPAVESLTTTVMSAPAKHGLQFDGNGDYVLINHSSSLNVGNQNSYSVVVWFSSTVRADQDLTDKWTPAGGAYPWAMRGPQSGNNGRVLFAIYDGTNNPGATTPSSYGALDNGQRHMVVGVRDFVADQVRIYVDGSANSATNTDTTNGNTANTRNATLGARTTSSTFFNGKIYEAHIYNRVLSMTEIEQLYAGTTITSGRVAAWLLDEGSGAVALDSSGNQNIGSIVNATRRNFIRK